MGNSEFKPRQIDLVTFSLNKIQTLQKNKQLNTYIKQNFKKNEIKPKSILELPFCYVWEFSALDLSFKNMKTLFQSLKQVKFQTIYLKEIENYEVSSIIKPIKDLENFQLNIIESLNFSSFAELKILGLRYCCIKSIEGLSFLYSPNLASLDISYNPFNNFKPFNKCTFKKLTTLRVEHNHTRQTYYLNHLTRCNLGKLISQIQLDNNYVKIHSMLYNPLEKPKQSIDMRPMLKWNSKVIRTIWIRQYCNLQNLIQQGRRNYELKIQQKIQQKYTSISIEKCFQTNV